MTKLLVDYANDHDIILVINTKDIKKIDETHPKGSDIKNTPEINVKIIKLLYKGYFENKINILYSDDDSNVNDQNVVLKFFKTLKLDVLEKGIKYNQYSLLKSIELNSTKLLKELIDYFPKNNIDFDINRKDNSNNYPLLRSAIKNNAEMMKEIMDYANKNSIILEINEKNNNGHSPILCSSFNNNIEIMKLLMDYATEHSIDLNINEKNQNGDYPLLWSIANNNLDMVQLLMNYGNKNNIILEVKEKNDVGNYPLVCSIVK